MHVQNDDAGTRERLTGFRTLVDQVRAAADTGDLATMRTMSGHVRQCIDDIGLLPLSDGRIDLHQMEEALDRSYDEAFPVGTGTDVAEVLHGPWPTPQRRQALLHALGQQHYLGADLDSFADDAVAALDVRLLRLTAATPLGRLTDKTLIRVLDTLHARAGPADGPANQPGFPARRG